MMQTVLKLGINDDEEKKKVMVTVCWFSGVDSISMDMKDKKLTVIGDIDPVTIVIELRKLCHTEIVSVGPAKERKEEEKKKVEPKKADKKKDESKKDDVSELVKAYQAYNTYLNPYLVEKPTEPEKKESKIEEPKKDGPKNDEVSDVVKIYKD